MKKVLLTSTALVAFAGAASAEVSLSGAAEMGLLGGDGIETQFIQSVDVRFSLSGETDGGLTFGATIDLDDAMDMTLNGNDSVDVATSDQWADFTVFISGNFGTVTMGDTDGAMDWALTEAGNIANPGSIADNETIHWGYLGSYLDGSYDGQILRYDNTFGDFGVALSVELDDTGALDAGYAVGFKYNAELAGLDLALGLGYQAIDEDLGRSCVAEICTGQYLESAVGFSVTTAFDNGLSAGLAYTQFAAVSGDEDVTHVGVGFGYAMDAFAVHLNYGQYDSDAFADPITGFGLTAAYDLGGGAAVNLGYAVSDNGTTDTDHWSLGLTMAF